MKVTFRNLNNRHVRYLVDAGEHTKCCERIWADISWFWSSDGKQVWHVLLDDGGYDRCRRFFGSYDFYSLLELAVKLDIPLYPEVIEACLGLDKTGKSNFTFESHMRNHQPPRKAS